MSFDGRLGKSVRGRIIGRALTAAQSHEIVDVLSQGNNFGVKSVALERGDGELFDEDLLQSLEPFKSEMSRVITVMPKNLKASWPKLFMTCSSRFQWKSLMTTPFGVTSPLNISGGIRPFVNLSRLRRGIIEIW